MPHNSRCYVCHQCNSTLLAQGITLHKAPVKNVRRPILDKWLEFLLLPPASKWPEEKWRKISLCSNHFTEDNFSGRRQVCLRRILVDNAVPTKYPPKDPGPFGELFTQKGDCKDHPKDSNLLEKLSVEKGDCNKEFTESEKEIPAIISDGFKFRCISREMTSGESLWRCCEKYCEACIRTVGPHNSIAGGHFQHNHRPVDKRKSKHQEISFVSKQRAEENLNRTPTEIGKSLFNEQITELVVSRDYSNVKRNVYSVKRRACPAGPKNIKNVQVEEEESLQMAEELLLPDSPGEVVAPPVRAAPMKQDTLRCYAPRSVALEKEEKRAEHKRQLAMGTGFAGASGEGMMVISDVHSVAPREVTVCTPRIQRRSQQQHMQQQMQQQVQQQVQQQRQMEDIQVMRMKKESVAGPDNDGGGPVAAPAQRPERAGAGPNDPKRRRIGKIRTEGMNVKAEPFDPDEPTSSSGQSNAELGAIRQLLSTLQKPVGDDQVFGEHVACELRSIRSSAVKKRLKKTIMLAIINAIEEDSYE